MTDWVPKRGDRVMIDDWSWDQMTPGSRRVGRRGGEVVGISMVYGEPTARVRWDGTKLPTHLSFKCLMPEDLSKHEPPPKETRDEAKSIYSRTQRARFRNRLRGMGVLTEELARKLNRALDALERGDFND